MTLRTIIVIVLILLVGYGIKEALPLIQGPTITLTSPKNGEKLDNSFITISGIASHTTGVSLDGGPLVTDQKGHFSTTMTLPTGGAILTLTATDRFGRTTVLHRDVAVP